MKSSSHTTILAIFDRKPGEKPGKELTSGSIGGEDQCTDNDTFDLACAVKTNVEG